MIHWGFIVLGYIAGFVSCYALIYQVAKIAAQVEGAIEKAGKRCSYLG